MPSTVRSGVATGEIPVVPKSAVRRLSPALLFEFARYFAVSVVALGVDVGLLLWLAQTIHYTIAASLSFLAGAVVHYLLSVRFVFRQRRLHARRGAELAIFVGAGALALLVNTGVIALGVEVFALPLLAAKMVAAVCSFVFGYVVRKLALF